MPRNPANAWVLRVFDAMEPVDSERLDQPDVSSQSREMFKDALYTRWHEAQQSDDNDG